MTNGVDLIIYQILTILFIVISCLLGFLLIFLAWKYYINYLSKLGKPIRKHAVLRDLMGNIKDIGVYHDYIYSKGVPVIRTETEDDPKNYDRWYMVVWENRIHNAMIEYDDEYTILTDFEKSNMEKHIVKSLLTKEIILTGLTRGIKNIKHIIEPILEEIEQLDKIIANLQDDAIYTKRDTAITKTDYLTKITNAFAPIYHYLLNLPKSATLMIKKRMDQARKETDGIEEDELKKFIESIETKREERKLLDFEPDIKEIKEKKLLEKPQIAKIPKEKEKEEKN